jgi:Mrp family chromosome partitioning ATPase
MTVAKENRRVLLVDLNFDAPALAPLLHVDAVAGLAELIVGGEPLELIKSTDVPRLDVLAAGKPQGDTAALLNTEGFTTLLTMLSTAYDHVIFDAPPLSQGDDARIVASLCDGTVLVSRSTSASLRRAAGARDLLLMIGANLLGVTVSRGTADTAVSSDTSSTARISV